MLTKFIMFPVSLVSSSMTKRDRERERESRAGEREQGERERQTGNITSLMSTD